MTAVSSMSVTIKGLVSQGRTYALSERVTHSILSYLTVEGLPISWTPDIVTKIIKHLKKRKPLSIKVVLNI